MEVRVIQTEEQRARHPVIGKQFAVYVVNQLELVCTGSRRPLPIEGHYRVTSKFIVDPCNDAESRPAARLGPKPDNVVRAKMATGFASHAYVAHVFQGNTGKGALTRATVCLGGKPRRSSGQQREGT
jgi:hypothetical protein